MFSGIIRDFGLVTEMYNDGSDSRRVEVESNIFEQRDYPPGSSMAVNGVCLTVVGKPSKNRCTFDLGAETLRRTNFGELAVASVVNLEPAICAGEPLDGHFVLGHIDGVGEYVSGHRDDASWNLEFRFPSELSSFIAPQGSVTIQGVGLTVVNIDGNHLSVSIVPHTAEHTNLMLLAPGDHVNIEVDCLARYIQRLFLHGDQALDSESSTQIFQRIRAAVSTASFV